MSRMWVLSEVCDWLRAWQGESPSAAFRSISRAATEQRALLEVCKRDRRFVQGATESEYEECVSLIESAVGPAKERKDQYDREYDERVAREKQEQDRAMKDTADRVRKREQERFPSCSICRRDHGPEIVHACE